jgi:hypothetical protein
MIYYFLEAHQISSIKEKTYLLGKIIIKRKGQTINKGESKIST